MRVTSDVLRVEVHADLAQADILECYAGMAARALAIRATKLLVIGFGDTNHHAHLAVLDAVIAMFDMSSADFAIALVPRGEGPLNAYTHTELHARQQGWRVRLFEHESAALHWLQQDA